MNNSDSQQKIGGDQQKKTKPLLQGKIASIQLKSAPIALKLGQSRLSPPNISPVPSDTINNQMKSNTDLNKSTIVFLNSQKRHSPPKIQKNIEQTEKKIEIVQIKKQSPSEKVENIGL